MKSLAFRLLLPFILLAPGSFGQSKPFRVISYNIYEGMRLDSAAGKPAFAAWLKKMDPDVVGLQEVTGFTQASLEALAKSYDHPYAVLLVEGEKFPVAITSKYPIVNVHKVTDNMDRGFIQATINGYKVISVHLTPFDYRKRREEAGLMMAHINSHERAKKYIVMGDFNIVAASDSLHYRDGRLIENYRKYEERYAPIKKLDNGKLDYTVIDEVLKAGFTDAVKYTHKEFVKSTHPRRFEPKVGTDVSSRIDFIFITNDLVKQIDQAVILADGFTDNYSDHYPVMLDLKR